MQEETIKDLILRNEEWYLGCRKIITEDGNLAEAHLGPENPLIQSSSKDSIFVCESFSEARHEIPSTFACFIRFWERLYNPYEMTCWIDADFVPELEVARDWLTPPRNILGEWPYPGWKKLVRQIKLKSDRTFVIRRKWLPKLQELLIDR